MNQNPTSNSAWEEKISWFKSSSQDRTLDTIDGEPMEFEWNIFPGFTTLQLSHKVHEFMIKMSDPSQFKGRVIFMSMFNDILWGSEDNEQECNANADLVSIFAKRFTAGRWSFLGPGSEKKWYSTYTDRPQGEWDTVAELMISNSEKADTQFPEQRVHCPEETLQSKGGGELSVHFCADGGTIETVFRTIIFVNQSSIDGAVSDLCDEYRTCQARTVRPVLAGQSDPLFEPASLLMTTPTPSTEVPAQENLLQKNKERVERLSQQNQLIKICIDAGFLKTVEVGHYFMTKHTDEFLQVAEPVTCRHETTHQLTRKVGFKGTPKLGQYWKSQLVTYKVNMDWKSKLNL